MVFGRAAGGPAFSFGANGFLETGENEEWVFEAAGAFDGFEEAGSKREFRVALGIGSGNKIDDGSVWISSGLLYEGFGGSKECYGTFAFCGGKRRFDGLFDLASEVEIVANIVCEESADDLEFGKICVATGFHS